MRIDPPRNWTWTRAAVLAASGLAFAAWLVANARGLGAAPDTLIRFSLSAAFAALILLRPKPAGADTPPMGRRGILLVAAIGAGAVVGGIVFHVRQSEWLGLLLLLLACLRWALPPRYGRDAALALGLLYWAHPLPGQVFGALQLAMQQLSVSGAEWMLHQLNARVWADGFVLRAGLRVFDVPEWCSGMRTATTVFLLSLGLGLLRRMRAPALTVLVAAALAQALILNVIRLTVMVLVAPRLADASGVGFLHDTAGIIVLAAVLLVYLEVEAWSRAQRRRARRREEDRSLRERPTTHPPFWRRVLEHRWLLAATAVGLVAAAVALYRGRREHRVEMLKGVVIALRDGGALADAQRLADIVWRLTPEDEDWRAERLRLLILRGRHAEALRELDRLPDAPPERAIEKRILRAYCLMGMRQLDQAAAVVAALPEDARRRDPRLAMILAELGLRANDPDEVAARVRVAARWAPNLNRIRALYPFLRYYRQWDAIADTQGPRPYGDPAQALSAVEALMNINRLSDVAALTTRAMAAWPEDPRVLEPLFYLALKLPDAEWEPRFADHLRRCVRAATDPDTLYGLGEKCFALARPDLAWTLCRRIEAIAPAHPARFMLAARHGGAWFAFRRRFVGLAAADPFEQVDLRGLFLLARTMPAWQPLARLVAFGGELAVADTARVRRAMLDAALAAFQTAEQARGLSLAMRYEYADALERAGDIPGAEAALARIAADNPDETEHVRIARSELLERRGRWPDVYEVLRDYPSSTRLPELAALLRLCRAQLNLRLGLAAIETARAAVRAFPLSTQAAGMLALTLGEFDNPEQTLFVLDRPRAREQRDLDYLEAETLFRTERYAEMQRLCKSLMLPTMPIAPDQPQNLFLPPAELSVIWHLVSIPSDREFAANAARLRANIAAAQASPFLSGLMRLWLERYARPGGPVDLAAWKAAGRDGLEQATALNQLCLLLGREGDVTAARNVAGEAVKLYPAAAIPWRILVSLSGGTAEVVAAARRHCPDDAELWLAELVTHCQGSGRRTDGGRQRTVGADAAWAEAYVRAAASNQTCSVAAMTRAGEYLLRGGLTNAAVAAARDVTSRARSLLPAYLLGLRCAVGTGDRAWALDCTRRAIDASIRPLPALYREMVRIKTSDGAVASDSEMVQALKALRADEPDNPLWAQMLSLARFKRGGWEVVDAMEQANAAIQSGAANRSSFILAAEASRLLRNHDRAADILHRGLTRFPGDPTLLNNLAYTLAMTPAGLAEAQALLPDLRRLEKRAPTGLRDTIVTVLIRAGRLDEAERALTEDTAKPAAGSPDAFRRDLHQAEIAWGRRQFEAAQRLLRDILTGSRDVPDEEILNANALLGKVDEALSAGGRTNAAPQPAQAALLRPEATESTARRRRATE